MLLKTKALRHKTHLKIGIKMKKKLLLGLVALCLIPSCAQPTTAWEKFKELEFHLSAGERILKYTTSSYSLFGAKYHKNCTQNRAGGFVAQDPQKVYATRPLPLFLISTFTKAATTLLSSKENSGKDVLLKTLKSGAGAALAGICLMAADTSELYAQEKTRAGNKTRANEAFFRFMIPLFARSVAVTSYLGGQNDVHPLTSLKNIRTQGIAKSFKEFMTKKHSLEEISKFCINTFVPLYISSAHEDVRFLNDREAAQGKSNDILQETVRLCRMRLPHNETEFCKNRGFQHYGWRCAEHEQGIVSPK